ncbi:hypothetical protein [Psychroflexus planctonicus]|uniref:Lipoprotein n=1 Tax=Psychroflexus planctonicus TaxID=1526575 RepID=A0ABQ1SHG8_9FLAO|nr:hypothetical protein [Psychroflexus planctonicus]GGE40268.1 hypothetical protein GCM10010832_20540 [Psychroflexus planctonicus]
MQRFILLLSFLFLISFYSCGTAYEIAFVKTQNGSKKPVLMKQDKEYLLVKESKNEEPKKIYYSDIDYVEKRISQNDVVKFKSFKVKGTKEYLLLEEEIVGPVSLYINTWTVNHNAMGQNIGMYQQTLVAHYVKREQDDEVILLSSDHFADNSLKVKGPSFFNDCPDLVSKN